MSDLDDLYQEVILEHSKHPRNFGVLPSATHTAEGDNPLCGDHFRVFLDVADGVIADVHFDGAGCAISTSSASLMTEAVKGRPVAEVGALFDRVHALLVGAPDPGGPELGKLAAFSGVQAFPMRVKCATLPWHTLKAALAGASRPVSTE